MSDGSLVPVHLEADPRLATALGRVLSTDEIRTWAGMPEAQRVKALQRIKALNGYCAPGSELTARQAAEQAGVKLGRFYQMARGWSERRSLDSLGAYVSATKPRQGLRPEVTNALQAVVARVVKARDHASIASLAKTLALESGLPPKAVPSQNTLRAFIEREQRRVRDMKLAGAELLFDLSASSLRREDGRPHVVFFVIDNGTRLILGHGQGLGTDSVAGYRAAAADSLRRIARFMPPTKIWADRMQRSQLVPGTDIQSVSEMAAQMKTELGGITPQLTGERKEGVYIREHIGLKLGPIRLAPSRTIAPSKPIGTVADAPGLVSEDAYARVELAVAEHNAELLADIKVEGAAEPPGELIRLLELMAAD